MVQALADSHPSQVREGWGTLIVGGAYEIKNLNASSFFTYRPKRGLRRHEFNRHVLHESIQPTRAFVHARLLARNMSNHDQRFIAPLSHGVGCIFDGLPFARFSHEQDLDIVPLERVRLSLESRRSWTKPNLGYLHFWHADHAHDGRVEFVGEFLRQFLDCGLGHNK